MDGDRRAYTGWKAGLLVIAAIVVFVSIANLTVNALRGDPPPKPDKIVITVTPTP